MPTYRLLFRLLWLFLGAVALVSCRNAEIIAPSMVIQPETPLPSPITTVSTPAATTLPGDTVTPAIVENDSVAGTSTPVYAGQLSPPCGVVLSPLPSATTNPAVDLSVSDATRAGLRSLAPTAAWPALQRLLDAPGTVGLVAFQAGREAEGVYLNGDIPMPLASVAKLITLVAYAEAIAAGDLSSQELVPLVELDRYYLPNFDLGAHRRAVAELRANDQILSPDDDPAVTLDNVAWMMIRHSSNAASDFLHMRLGQARVEETAVALGLNDTPASHSAPCAFLGQFLMMANHSRGSSSDQAFLADFVSEGTAGAESYGREVSLLLDAYVNQEAFRREEQDWREATRRPTIETQRFFAARLAPQGTAGAYAALMARLAQNGLSNGDSSFQARRILEWPNQFAANQDLFSNVGYKNGSLPGVLTTAYYAYRWGDVSPVIVILFYRDLPQQTYRQWRRDLPHDELARWLLADPAALPALSSALNESAVP